MVRDQRLTKTKTCSLCEAESNESMFSTLGNVEKFEGKTGVGCSAFQAMQSTTPLQPVTSATTSKGTTTSTARIIVKWSGHSSYEIEASDKIIYIDRVQNIFKSIG